MTLKVLLSESKTLTNQSRRKN